MLGAQTMSALATLRAFLGTLPAPRRTWHLTTGILAVAVAISSASSLAAPMEQSPKPTSPSGTPQPGGTQAQTIHTQAVQPSCGATPLLANDDGSSPSTPIGFTINFFGTSYSSLFVNNNGN